MTTMSPGQVMSGGVVATTVTVKVQVAQLYRLSMAVQYTVVVPTGKSVVEAGVQVIFTGFVVHWLVAVAVNGTTAPEPVHSVTMLLGQKICTQGRLVCQLPKSRP